MSAYTVVQYSDRVIYATDELADAISWSQQFADRRELSNRGATIHLVITSWGENYPVRDLHVYGGKPLTSAACDCGPINKSIEVGVTYLGDHKSSCGYWH